jgi:hypothetical protein
VDRFHRKVTEDLSMGGGEPPHDLLRARLEGQNRVADGNAQILQAVDVLETPAQVVDDDGEVSHREIGVVARYPVAIANRQVLDVTQNGSGFFG